MLICITAAAIMHKRLPRVKRIHAGGDVSFFATLTDADSFGSTLPAGLEELDVHKCKLFTLPNVLRVWSESAQRAHFTSGAHSVFSGEVVFVV